MPSVNVSAFVERITDAAGFHRKPTGVRANAPGGGARSGPWPPRRALYIAEIAPVARRGTLICIFQLMITVGILLAYVGLAVLPGENEWRLLLGGGAIMGVILSGLALLLVESPVWLALMGDYETATAVRARMGLDSSPDPVHEIELATRDPRIASSSAVFSLAGRGAIVIGIGLFFVQQFVGINAVLYYSTANLPRLADTTSEFGVANATGVVLAAVNMAATIVAVALVDRVGRRPLLLTSLVGVAVGCAAMAVGAAMHATSTGHILSVTGLYLFIVLFAVGLGPIPWVAAAELLPIRARGIAMGVVVASHWLFDGVAAPTGLLLGRQVGLYLLLVLYMCTAIGGFVVFRQRFPETKGRSLAAISRYFAVWPRRSEKPASRIMRWEFWVPCPECSPVTTWRSPRRRWYCLPTTEDSTASNRVCWPAPWLREECWAHPLRACCPTGSVGAIC